MDFCKEQIKTNPLFCGLSENELELLLHFLTDGTEEYEEGESFVWDRHGYIGIVLEGEISLLTVDRFGKINVIETSSAPSAAGKSSASSAGGFGCLLENSGVTAVAKRKSTMLFFNYKKLCEWDFPNNKIQITLLKNIQSLLLSRFTDDGKRLCCLSQKTIRDKILFLLNTVPGDENIIKLPMNRQQMADYLAIDRSALSREIMKMKAENIIKDYCKNEFTIK